MVILNDLKVNDELHTIIRFISECQIKHSFIFNQLICEDINKCLKYLIKRDLNIKNKMPFEKQKIKSILTNVINNSIGIELIFCEDKPLVDKTILDKLDFVLESL